MDSVATHCPYCALQCAMRLTDTPGNELAVDVQPRQFPANQGGLCRKGWTSAQVLATEDRLRQPLLRDARGELRETTWEKAYRRIVEGVHRARARGGADGVAVFGGGGLTNEKAYSLGKFARVGLGTAMIDYNGRFCMSSAAAAGGRTLGLDRGLPFPLTDIGGAEAVLLVGSNPAETMPPFVQHLRACRDRGGLIVIDPRRTPTAALADEGCGQHLQPLPGTDITVLLGLLHLVIVGGGADETYLADRVNGWEEVKRSAMMWWPELVERVTGVPVADLRFAADILMRSAPVGGGLGTFVLTGRGAEQHAHGTDTVSAAMNLALALGLPGRVGSGYGCLTGQGNGQGGREHGQKCDQLPGYRKITDPEARNHMASIWGVEETQIPGAGIPAVQLLTSLGTPEGASMLFIHGANPLVSGPNSTSLIQHFAALDTLVVTDFILSETAAIADVVLPTLQWAEEEGTMTNLEGRILRRRRAIDLLGNDGPRDELRIWHDLAVLLDAPATFSTDPQEVFDELARASAGGIADYSGLSHELLDTLELCDDEGGVGAYWPVDADTKRDTGLARPAEYVSGAFGTPRLFLERFATPNGRAQMINVRPTGVDEDLCAGTPLYLLTGRVMEHYQSGAQTRRVSELNRIEPYAFVQIHPLTAETLGVEEGDEVRVCTRFGEATGRARLSNDIRRDCIFMPFHYAGVGSANRVTNPALDPISSMPEFKVCAASVTRAVSSKPEDGNQGGREGNPPSAVPGKQ